jgi:Ca2+-binding RTX toxin-like protein
MSTPTTSSPYSSVAMTGYQFVDALLAGTRWSSSTITYSIPALRSYWSNASTAYGPSTGADEPWSQYFDALTTPEAARFRLALQTWSHVANINFVETADNSSTVGDLRIAYTWLSTESNSEAWAYLPGDNPKNGDIWINAKSNSNHSSFADGSYSFLTMVHELGHTLGLKHPFEASESNTVTDPAHDSVVYSLMSYSADTGNPNTDLSFYPTTPMVYDVLAIQDIYGQNLAYNAGDTTYNFKDGNTYLQTIWDGGGNNTISYTGLRAASIDLREGHGSTLGNEVDVLSSSGAKLYAINNVWIAFGTKIQTAIGGSGYNLIMGNDLGNRLVGGSGGNVISGGAGSDTISVTGGDSILDGAGGNDIFFGLSGREAIYGGVDTDTLNVGLNAAQCRLGKLRDGAFVVLDGNGDFALCRNVEKIAFNDGTFDLSTLTTFGNADASLAQLYMAAFRRAPETSGYNYWAQQKAAQGLNAVADTIFSLDIVKAIYPTNLSANQFVTSIYQNVFNRAPDTEGLNYWMQQLAAKSRGQLVLDMTNVALAVPDGTDGKDFFQNRVDWALYSVGYQAARGTEMTPAHLTSLTNGVTSDVFTTITLIGQAESGVSI